MSLKTMPENHAKPRCNRRTGEVQLPTTWSILAQQILNDPDSAMDAAKTLAWLIVEVDK